jgi:hypothetical protein
VLCHCAWAVAAKSSETRVSKRDFIGKIRSGDTLVPFFGMRKKRQECRCSLESVFIGRKGGRIPKWWHALRQLFLDRQDKSLGRVAGEGAGDVFQPVALAVLVEVAILVEQAEVPVAILIRVGRETRVFNGPDRVFNGSQAVIRSGCGNSWRSVLGLVASLLNQNRPAPSEGKQPFLNVDC